jgi:hypothetical protein
MDVYNTYVLLKKFLVWGLTKTECNRLFFKALVFGYGT